MGSSFVGPLRPLVDAFFLGPPGRNFSIDLSYVFHRVACCFSFLSFNLSVFFSYRRLSCSQLDVQWSMLQKVFALIARANSTVINYCNLFRKI